MLDKSLLRQAVMANGKQNRQTENNDKSILRRSLEKQAGVAPGSFAPTNTVVPTTPQRIYKPGAKAYAPINLRSLAESTIAPADSHEQTAPKYVSPFAKNEDYQELSRYKSTKNAEDIDNRNFLDKAIDWIIGAKDNEESKKYNSVTGYTTKDYDDELYEYINRNPDVVSRVDTNESTSGQYFSGVDQSFLQEMDDAEIADYNYLYATQGKDKANEFLQNLKKDLTKRQMDKYVAENQQYARESPVAASAWSVLAKPLEGVSLAGQLMDYKLDRDMDPNAGYNRFVKQNQTIRQTVPENWSKVGQFLYGTGMSIVDNLYNMALTGAFGNVGGLGEGAQSLILGIMGSSAAAESTLNALENGYSADRAMLQGAIAGGIEALTEKISLETLLSPNAFKDGTIKYLLKNAAAEGSEEGASTVANWVVDWIGDLITDENRSDFRQVFTAFDRGDTKEGWRKIGEMGLDLAQDVAGGMLSGGVLAGGGSVANTIGNINLGSALNQTSELSDMSEFVNDSYADSLKNPDATRYQKQLSQKALEQFYNDGKVSNRTLGELAQNNMYMAEEQANTVNLLNEASQRINQGKQITSSQMREILDNKQAVRTLRDNNGLRLNDNMSYSDRFNAVQDALTNRLNSNDAQVKLGFRADMVAKFAKTLGSQGERTLNAMARANGYEDVEAFSKGYTQIYNAVKADPEVKLNDLSVKADYSFTPQQLNTIYKSAVKDYEADLKKTGLSYEGETNAEETATGSQDSGTDGVGTVSLDSEVATGSVAGRTAEAESRRKATDVRIESIRNNAALNSIAEVTSAEAGIPGGVNTDQAKTVRVLSESQWSALDTDTYNFLHELKDMGYEVKAWTGTALAYDEMSGKNAAVRGFIQGNTIGVRVDANLSARKIAYHEMFHDMVKTDSSLQADMVKKINEHYGEGKLETIVRDYVSQYGWTKASSEEILNEILADAYAGIDIYEDLEMNYEGATQVSSDVRGFLSENGVKTRNGSNAGQFSRDTENKYLEAIKSGDTDTAQQIVDAAAKEAGYTIKAYHGTTENFNSFSRNKQGTNHDGYLEFGAGFYFTPNKDEAREWVRRGRSGQSGKATAKVMSVYLNPGRIIGADDAIQEAVSSLQTMGLSKADASFISNRVYRLINYLLEEKGFSNTEVQETLKGFGYDAIDASYGSAIGKPSGQYVVFDPEQIKSADPVTYDDNGEPISLSDRFNAGKNDIRYSRDKWQIDGQMSLSDLEGYYREKYDNVSEENIKVAAKETKGIIERIQNFQDKEVRNKSEKRVLGNIRTIALGITSEFIKTGYIDFGRLKLSKNPSKAAAQIASYAMILRNPNFETFRILYTKGNQIVGNSAVTSYNVDTSYAALDKDMDTSNGMIRDQMKRLGADGYYLMHNHPSGSVNYSNADKQMTDYYRRTIAGFKGHIIIDHNQYGFFDASPDMKYSVNDIENGNAKDIHSRRINSPLLYRVINGPGSLADIAQDVVHNNDISTLIYAHNDGIRAIQEVNNKFLLSKDFKNYVNNRKLDFGSVQTFLVTNMKTFNEVDRSNLFSTGLFTDVVGDGETDELFGKSFYSLHELGRGQWGTVKEAGLYRVYEEDNGESAQYSRDTSYMDAVNSGDMDTAQRMVDEAAKDAGYTIKAYHGTPNGTFNVFNDWSYFTENKDYADIYQKQGASSNRYKQTASNPRTYSVYLDPKEVFDTRNPRDREIFQNEFYMQWGNGTPLSERGLPDWTDGDDLIEFFEENDYDYNAFYLDEGGTGGYGEETKDRGISIIVKDSAQIKSADPVTYDDQGNVIPLSQRFNSQNNDIRYSRDSEQDNKVKANFGTMFSGTGTVDFALRNVINHSFAVEYDNNISAVYRMNNGDEIYEGDVRDAVKQGYMDDKEVDFLHASPVCKDYSAQKQDATETPLDISTAKAVADVIDSKRPKIVTIENVRGYKNSRAVKLIQDALDRNGYVWDEDTYKASDFGGATIRERYFIRAARDVSELPAIPEKKQAKSWYEATKDLIPDLREMPLKKGGYMESRWNEIKDSIDRTHPVLLLRGTKGGNLVYAEYDKPSPTIIASETEARIVMPDGRFLEASPRVLARIQGLPDEFKLPKQKTLANKVVGNGVPVELTQAVLGSLLPVISGEDYSDIRFSRDTTGMESELQKQNRELNQELKEVTERYHYFKDQLVLTKVRQATEKSANRVAKQLVKDYSSNVSADEIAKALREASKLVLNVKDDTDIDELQTQLKDALRPFAMQMVTNASELMNAEDVETQKSIRNDLRNGTGIIVTEQMKKDVPDWASFRKAQFGNMKLVSGPKTNIHDVYLELSQKYGEGYFPQDVSNESDMLQVIADVMADLSAIYDNPYTYGGANIAEAIESCTNDMMMSVVGSLEAEQPTFADKEKAKRDALRKQAIEAKNAALQRVREQRDKTLAKQSARYKDRIDSIYRKRKQYEYRGKIRKKSKDLSTLLLRPTDKRHIPYELQGVVLEVLKRIDTGSSFDFDLNNGTAHVPRGTGMETGKTNAFLNLKKQLSELKNHLVLDPSLFDSEDGGTMGMLSTLSGLESRSIDDMNLEQLDAVYTVLRNVENLVQKYNKALKLERFETISEAATAIFDENGNKTSRDEYVKGIEDTINLLAVDSLTPQAFFHRLGKSGDALFKMLRAAQDDNIRILREAQKFSEDHGLYKLKLKKYERELVTVRFGNRDVEMSKAQLMELYVLNKRDASRMHLEVGGILPEPVQRKRSIKKVTYSEAIHNITQEDIAKAMTQLSAEDIALADAMQEFLSKTISKHGNDASMRVYGYKKFGEENYWPIRVNDQELKTELGKSVKQRRRSVSQMGFTIAIKPNAKQSVFIGSIFDTFSEHVAEMATYSSYLDVMEDLNRIYNFNEKDESGAIDMSTKLVLRKVLGPKGEAYFTKLAEDIANPVPATPTFFSGLIGKFKAAAVGSNLRVIIQQPTAIFRAMSMIDPKYLAIGIAKFRQGANKAVEKAPIAQWKEWGYFDISTGRSVKNILFENSSTLDRAQNLLMAGAGKADSVAWGALYSAVEAETKDLRPDLDPRSKEFDDVVVARFSDIIDQTQVVDGVLQRSHLMRSENWLDKTATSFMAEPTKQLNMMMSAVYDLVHGENKGEATRTLARTTGALLFAGVLNAAVQSIVDAIRNDDPEKDYWEKFLAKFTGDEATFAGFLDSNLGDFLNPMQYVTYAKDIYSLFQGFEVERMDTSLLKSAINDGKSLVNAFNGKGKYSLTNNLINFMNTMSKFLGLSVSNVKRDVAGIANTIAQETGSYVFEYRMAKFTYNLNQATNKGRFVEVLAKAYEAGDTEAFNIIMNDLIKEDKFATTTMTTEEWIKKRLKEKHQIVIK